MKFICKICGKKYDALYPVGRHFKKEHNMSIKEYYDKYIKTENEGKCLNCGKETFFHRLSTGYLKYCSNTCQMAYQMKTNHNGCLDRKIKNEQKEKEKHEKCIQLFGEDNKNNRIKLGLLNSGDNFIKTNSEAFNKTIKNKYGIEFYTKTEEFKINKAKKDWYRFKQKHDSNTITFLRKNEHSYTAHCNICNKNFEINFPQFRYRLKRNINLCTNCKPLRRGGKNKSLLETMIYDYVNEIYDGIVLHNTRKIISPKELDIWLPEIKLGIEFNGMYWHADPHRFKSTDIVVGNKTAQEIWYRDELKKKMCKDINIDLIIINESDFINNKENIFKKLKEYIDGKCRLFNVSGQFKRS